MGTVQPEARTDFRKTSFPAKILQHFPDQTDKALGILLPKLLKKEFCRTDHGGRIIYLIHRKGIQVQKIVTIIIGFYGKINAGWRNPKVTDPCIPGIYRRRRPHPFDPIPDHPVRFLAAGIPHHRRGTGDDPCLLPCHFGDGMAQVFLVIQSYLGDHVKLCRNAGGGVQPSSQPGFQHNAVHLLFMEMYHGHDKKQLKEGELREMPFLPDLFHGPENGNQRFVADLPGIYLYTLIHPHQMG